MAFVVVIVVAVSVVTAQGWWSRLTDLVHPPPAEVALDPSLFARGSCEAFAPTTGDRHLTVFLDAGHGGRDPGGVGTTTSGVSIEESRETLRVELRALTTLRAQGYRVVVSRTTNNTVLKLNPADVSGNELSVLGAHDDVAARDQCANLAHANLLVGLYFDAGSPQYAGSLTAYDASRPFAAQNKRFASMLQHDVVAAMNARGWAIPNDGVDTDTLLGSVVTGSSSATLSEEALNYNHLMLIGPAAPGYFTTPSAMPGALIEPLYLTDPYEGTLANSSLGQAVIAQGVVQAINQYFAPRRHNGS